MFQAQNLEAIKKNYKTQYPDLQDQDQDHFWSEPGLVLRPTVSDHTTDIISAMQVLCYSSVAPNLKGPVGI